MEELIQELSENYTIAIVTHNMQQAARVAEMTALGRVGLPDDIANLVSFLAAPDGGWINSQVLRANGGFA